MACACARRPDARCGRIAGLGYAIPGAVIAVGVLLPFALDNALDAWMRATFGISTGLLLTGTIGVLLFAYLVRFLALALNTVEAGLAKINRNLDDAARVLGRTPGRTLVRVHVPLLWGSVLTAVILVFVDVLKELPATLICARSTSRRSRSGSIASPPTSAWPRPRPRRSRSCWSACCRSFCSAGRSPVPTRIARSRRQRRHRPDSAPPPPPAGLSSPWSLQARADQPRRHAHLSKCLK